MKIKEAVFVTSNTEVSKCPESDLPEYAFIGRSNVGKSSLINMLTGQKKLAKTSSMPGKTQLINHFLVDNQWYLVDLPGYGFAKVSKKSRESWTKMINKYLTQRKNLSCLFVLIDSRHEPLKVDLDFIHHLGTLGVPFVLVFTKADKQSAVSTQKNVAAYKKTLKKTWEELPNMFISSAENRLGKEDILEFIDSVNKQLSSE